MIGKYMNGYGEPTRGPARLVGVVRGRSNDQRRLRLQAERERHPRPATAQDAADFKQDVLTRQGGRLHRSPGPEGAAVLPLAQLHGPARGRPGAEPDAADLLPGIAAKPAPRHANAFDSEPLPRPRTSTRPTSPTSRWRSATARAWRRTGLRTIERRYRCQLESLLSVDEGVEKVVEALRLAGSSPTRCSSSPRTTVSSTASTGSAWTSGTSTRSRSGCRCMIRGPGIPPGVDRRRPDDQRRSGADDPRRGECQPRSDHGRALADSGHAKSGHRAGTPVADRGRALVSTAALQGDPDRALRIRRARHRREGTLRSSERSVRALEPP